MAVAEKNGNDFHLGRKLPRLLRGAGLMDVRVNPIIHIESVGNPRRFLSVDFLDNMRERILALHLVAEGELVRLRETLARHLDNPDTVVFHGPYIQAWGRKPA